MENIKTPKKLVDLFNEPKKDTLDEGKVINPLTNRLISKDGAVYKKLVKDGVIKGTDAKPPKTPKLGKPKIDAYEKQKEKYATKYKNEYPDGIPATKENIKKVRNDMEDFVIRFLNLTDKQNKEVNDDIDTLLRLENPLSYKNEIERIKIIGWYFVLTPEEKEKRKQEIMKKKYDLAFVPPPKLGTKIGKGLNKDYLQQKFYGPHKDYIKGTKFYK